MFVLSGMSDLRRGSRNRPCARFKKNKTYLSTLSAGVIAIVMMTLVPMNAIININLSR